LTEACQLIGHAGSVSVWQFRNSARKGSCAKLRHYHGETAQWLAGIGDDLHDKLAAVGLVSTRRSQTLGGFLDDYFVRRAHDWKPGSLTTCNQTQTRLIAAFGVIRDLRMIGVRDAEASRAF
jgi:hypothetical protein